MKFGSDLTGFIPQSKNVNEEWHWCMACTNNTNVSLKAATPVLTVLTLSSALCGCQSCATYIFHQCRFAGEGESQSWCTFRLVWIYNYTLWSLCTRGTCIDEYASVILFFLDLLGSYHKRGKVRGTIFSFFLCVWWLFNCLPTQMNALREQVTFSPCKNRML